MRYVLAVALIMATAVGLAWHRSSTLQADLVEAALVAADAEEEERPRDSVSPDGCQVEIDAVLDGRSIDFESSSAELDPTSIPLLDELVTVLVGCGEAQVEVAGHTDASGPREDNLALSLHRAETVKVYLLAGSVAAELVTAIGYGPDQSVADNATPEGRAQNRRIEVKVLRP